MYQIDAVVPVTIKVQKGEIKFQPSNSKIKRCIIQIFPDFGSGGNCACNIICCEWAGVSRVTTSM